MCGAEVEVGLLRSSTGCLTLHFLVCSQSFWLSFSIFTNVRGALLTEETRSPRYERAF